MLTVNQRSRFCTKFVELEREARLSEPVVFSWLQPTEKPPTGCWSFVDGAHRIRVNIDCANKSVVTTARGASTFAEMIARHEFGHAKHTERDFKAANDMLKRIKAPFMLFNLFEDARIDWKERSASGKAYNWMKWEKPSEPKCPVSIFFWFCQNEIMPYHAGYRLRKPSDLILGQGGISLAAIGYRTAKRRVRAMLDAAQSGGISRSTVALVFQFYVEVTRTTNTMSLECWLARWMELFPNTNGEGNGIGEIVEGSHYSDQIAPEEITADVRPPRATPSADKDGEAGRGKGGRENPQDSTAMEQRDRDITELAGDHEESNQPRVKGRHITHVVHKDELVEGAKIASLMTRGFRCRGVDRTKTLSSSKRLAIRDIAVGNIAKPFIRTDVQTQGVPKVAVVVDFSGSMSGSPMHNARILMFALNRLVKSGVIKCHLFATLSSCGCFTEQVLPTRVENISWQAQSGGEGMRLFFSQKMTVLQEFDAVIVFTDGDIGDTGTDFRALHSRGIFVVGAYVSNLPPASLLEQQRKLAEYFDKGIARPDMVSLASDITRLITNR